MSPAGARGETQERLAAVLGYPAGLRCVHGALQQLAAVPGLLAASQIFHHPGEPGASGGGTTRMGANPEPPDAPLRCAALSLQPRFLNESERFYKALPQELSGNESLDLQRINAWVRQATRGRLPRLLAQLPPEPRLVLLSAVHFQGTPLLFGFWGCLRARCPAGTPHVPTVPCPRSPLADAVQGQGDGAAALPAPRPPARARAHHDQQEVPRGLLHRLPPAGPGTQTAPPQTSIPRDLGWDAPLHGDPRLHPPGGAAGAERGAEPGGAGATGSPGGAGGRGAGAGPPDLPGAAAEGGRHPDTRHRHRPAPRAPRPRHGCGGPGPRHG